MAGSQRLSLLLLRGSAGTLQQLVKLLQRHETNLFPDPAAAAIVWRFWKLLHIFHGGNVFWNTSDF